MSDESTEPTRPIDPAAAPPPEPAESGPAATPSPPPPPPPAGPPPPPPGPPRPGWNRFDQRRPRWLPILLVGLIGLLIGAIVGCGIGFVAGHFGEGHGDRGGHSRFDNRPFGGDRGPVFRGPGVQPPVAPANPPTVVPTPTKS
jgi:hypothetical protein